MRENRSRKVRQREENLAGAPCCPREDVILGGCPYLNPPLLKIKDAYSTQTHTGYPVKLKVQMLSGGIRIFTECTVKRAAGMRNIKGNMKKYRKVQAMFAFMYVISDGVKICECMCCVLIVCA